MFSFNVTTLLIDPELVKESMALILQNTPNLTKQVRSKYSMIKILRIMGLINFTTYFQFGGQIYQQIRGAYIGSLLLTHIIEMVTQCLETISLL